MNWQVIGPGLYNSKYQVRFPLLVKQPHSSLGSKSEDIYVSLDEKRVPLSVEGFEI